jgi:FkbM family methyltransferase
VGENLNLTLRQQATWLSHFSKAALRDHHQELEPLFGPLLKPDAVIVDVGAHGGQMSRMFARLAPRGTIHAFEPAAYARSVLGAALALRGPRFIRVWPYALSDGEGELVISTPIKKSSALGFGLAHVAAEGETGRFRRETVRATTLDTFVAEQKLARIDFIKVDIEGWELRFLRGAEGAIARFRPHLFVEVSASTLARAGDTPQAVFDFFARHGYSAKRLTDADDLAPVSGFTGNGDYLFSPA